MDRESLEKSFLGIERFELFLGVCAAFAVTVLAISTLALVYLAWTLEKNESQRHETLITSIELNNFYSDLTRLHSENVKQQVVLNLMTSRAQRIVNDLNAQGKRSELEDFIRYTTLNLKGVYNYNSIPHLKPKDKDLSGLPLSNFRTAGSLVEDQ